MTLSTVALGGDRIHARFELVKRLVHVMFELLLHMVHKIGGADASPAPVKPLESRKNPRPRWRGSTGEEENHHEHRDSLTPTHFESLEEWASGGVWLDGGVW